MILSDQEIWMELSAGLLLIEPPVESDQIVSSAIDLHLGNQFTVFESQLRGVTTKIDTTEIDVEDVVERHGKVVKKADGEEFILKRNEFVLAYTKESITMPNYLAARIEGRSSLARAGISIHQTAPTVHANFSGKLRLELSLNGPFECIIRPGQKFCQLIIERLGRPSQSTRISTFQGQGRQDLEAEK